jgi:translation initiation factor IF-2
MISCRKQKKRFHAQAAGAYYFAINKVDKPNANPEKLKRRLAGMNLLVEDGVVKSNFMISRK